jgi:hypothetical protein
VTIRLHPHAQARLIERGATVKEVMLTIEQGQPTPAKFNRTRFRRSFPFNAEWRGKRYAIKQIDAFAAEISPGEWLVITVIVKFLKANQP